MCLTETYASISILLAKSKKNDVTLRLLNGNNNVIVLPLLSYNISLQFHHKLYPCGRLLVLLTFLLPSSDAKNGERSAIEMLNQSLLYHFILKRIP